MVALIFATEWFLILNLIQWLAQFRKIGEETLVNCNKVSLTIK
jgi:hypothetical protein